MMQLIAPDWYGQFVDELQAMHRLRYRVFKGRLDWDIRVNSGLEIDSYDALKPVYLILRSSNGRVDGCVRFLPSIGPTMLRDTFSILLDGQQMRCDPRIWESSRFALDLPQGAPKGAGGIALGTYELFAGMIEFGLARRLSNIIAVTDLRMERILRRAGWTLERIGKARTIGKARAVAGFLSVSTENLEAVRTRGGLNGPVLWAPVGWKPA